MRGLFGRRAGAIVAVLGSLFCTASATTVQRLDFKGLTAYSTNVVVGTVGASRAERTPDGGLIVTLVDLTVTEQWKGVLDSTALRLRLPGGRIDREVIEIPGVPVLEHGQQALLFLEKNPDGTFGVVSFAQGSYKLGADPAGRKVATRDIGALSLLAVSGNESTQIVDGVWELTAIRADVDAAIAAGTTKETLEAAVIADATPLDDVDPVTNEVKGGGK